MKSGIYKINNTLISVNNFSLHKDEFLYLLKYEGNGDNFIIEYVANNKIHIAKGKKYWLKRYQFVNSNRYINLVLA